MCGRVRLRAKLGILFERMGDWRIERVIVHLGVIDVHVKPGRGEQDGDSPLDTP